MTAGVPLWRRVLRRARLGLDPVEFARTQALRAGPWFLEGRHRGSLNLVDEAGLRGRRRSDTAFVFGSGASLKELSSAEWAHIAAHDTIGFNYFVRQRFVRLDFHLVGEVATVDDRDATRWRPALLEYAALIDENPYCRDTLLGLQQGWKALQSNRLVGLGLVPRCRQVFRYWRVGRGVFRPPTTGLDQGLVLGAGSLCAAINLAYVLGFKEIVVTGVDLYDSRYFWLEDDRARPDFLARGRLDPGAPHPTAMAVVPYLGRWAALMAAEGVRLSVYDRRSLLSRELPLYDRSPSSQ